MCLVNLVNVVSSCMVEEIEIDIVKDRDREKYALQ